MFAVIAFLRDKAPGSFIIRNSNTFQGAFGLAVKVSQIPPNVQPRSGTYIYQHIHKMHFLYFLCYIYNIPCEFISIYAYAAHVQVTYLSTLSPMAYRDINIV